MICLIGQIICRWYQGMDRVLHGSRIYRYGCTLVLVWVVLVSVVAPAAATPAATTPAATTPAATATTFVSVCATVSLVHVDQSFLGATKPMVCTHSGDMRRTNERFTTSTALQVRWQLNSTPVHEMQRTSNAVSEFFCPSLEQYVVLF